MEILRKQNKINGRIQTWLGQKKICCKKAKDSKWNKMRVKRRADFILKQSSISWMGLYKNLKGISGFLINLQSGFILIQQHSSRKSEKDVQQPRTHTHTNTLLSILLKDEVVTGALLIKPKQVLIVIVFSTNTTRCCCQLHTY